jgi:hypothetical protein
MLGNDGGAKETDWPRGIARVQPPWFLRGDAFLVLTISPTETNLADAAISNEMAGIYNNLFNVMVVADYRESPIGPFRELAYIPGRFRFAFDEERMSITRSYATTEAGVLNRRAHWGVPTEFAEIVTKREPSDHEHFSVGQGKVADFSFECFGPSVPLNGKVIPPALRSFGQLRDDMTLLYTLGITGTMRAARFIPHSFDASRFPDMTKRQLVVSIKVSDFLAEFPLTTTLGWTTA